MMETSWTPLQFAAGLLALTVFLLLKLRTIGKRGQDFPPGPKTAPILGNALDFPTTLPHLKFSEWARQYGDVFSLKIFNQTVVVLSSAAAVKHILDANGTRTGNRPQSVLVHRVDKGSSMAFANMERPVWKQGRKFIHAFLTKDSLGRHMRTQQLEYSQLMHDILEDPKNTFEHVCRTTSSIMIALIYGSRVSKYPNSLAQTHFHGVKLFNQVVDFGAHPPVDLFWPLQYVPKRWAYWKRLADATREIRDGLYGSLHAQCERAIKDDMQTGCYVETLILNQEKLGVSREGITGLGAVMMDGGAETTASFLQSFILAMINNPDVQEKGQKEIDHVIGPDRSPALEDYDSVPYIRAIVNEVFRFRPGFPVAAPHVSTKVVCYKHYRIPEDSVIFMNVYGIYHDPELYDDPEMFDPERFLRTPFGVKEGVDTKGFRNNFGFGAGLRICPGESMARRTIASATMHLLWAFDFKKDGSGTGGQDVDSYATPGIELAPKPFTCDVTPRSAVKAQMIRDRYAEAFPAATDGANAF